MKFPQRCRKSERSEVETYSGHNAAAPPMFPERRRSTGIRWRLLLFALLLALPRVPAVLDKMVSELVASTSRGSDPDPSCAFEFRSRPAAAEPGHLQAQSADGPIHPQMCGLLTASKYYNRYCDTLPLVEPSAGCNAVDLENIKSWMPSEPRTVWLWGDSVLKQVWYHLVCMLSKVVPPEDISQDVANLAFVADNMQPQSQKKKKIKVKAGVVSWINWGAKGIGGKLLQPPLKWSPKLAKLSCKPIYGCARFGNLKVCYGDVLKDSAFYDTTTTPCFVNSAATDIHVINYGMWHNDRRGLPVATKALSTFLRAMAVHKGMDAMPRIVWFETTPQHFLSKGGLFSAKPGTIQKGCMTEAPLAQMRKLEFRNRVTLPLLNSSSLQEVAPMHVFRTWELFAPHPKLHDQRSQGKIDCVHWCEYDGGAVMALGEILLSDLSRAFWGASSP